MSAERNPHLEKIFEAAEQTLEDEAFVAGVMVRAGRPRWRRLVLPIAICLASIAAVWFIAAPLNEALVGLLAPVFRPLTAVGGGWTGLLLAPLNSIPSLLLLGILVLRSVLRKVFV